MPGVYQYSVDRLDGILRQVTESGIAPLKQTLRELEKRGVRGRVLTTDYLTFSQPKALAWLNERPNIEVRMYSTGELDGRKRDRT